APDQRHQVRGTEGVGIAQDAEGDAEAWVRGRGEAIDGRTRDRIVFTRRAQAESQVNNIRIGNKKGSRFASTCNGGCEWSSPTGEHLVVEGTCSQIKAVDVSGARGRIKFLGGGESTNGPADVVHADTHSAGETDIIGRGRDLS